MKFELTVYSIIGIAILFLSFNVAENDRSTSNVFKLVSAQDIENIDEKLYVILFEPNKIGNIDNSTKIISSVVGTDLIKIEEELLEEMSLAPSQELEEQVNEIINNGTKGLPCEGSFTTQDGDSVGVDCIFSEKHIIWHVYLN